MSYNGWSNRPTWNVNLWLSNDEGLYHEVNRLERRHVRTDQGDDFSPTGAPEGLDDFADAIELFCRELWPDGLTPDGDKLSEADFDEIAVAWVDP
jgi:hypothetical protein